MLASGPYPDVISGVNLDQSPFYFTVQSISITCQERATLSGGNQEPATFEFGIGVSLDGLICFGNKSCILAGLYRTSLGRPGLAELDENPVGTGCYDYHAADRYRFHGP